MTQWPVNTTQTTGYLKALVSIDSVNPDLVPGGAGENEIAAWLAQTCESLGLDMFRLESVHQCAAVLAEMSAAWTTQAA